MLPNNRLAIFQQLRSWLGLAQDDGEREQNLKVFSSTHRTYVILASVLVTGLLLSIRQIGILQSIELAVFDQMVRLKPYQSPDPHLLVVGITESDLENQKEWPLSDQVLAKLLEKLQKYQPKVIGLDLYRDLPHPPGHEDLLKQLEADNVIVIKELGGSNKKKGVLPPPSVPQPRVGFNDLVIDPDNIVRRNLLYAQSPSGSKKVYSFALKVSLRYLSKLNKTLEVHPNYLQIGETKFPRLQANSGGYQMDKSEMLGWQILLNYRPYEHLAEQVSLEQVLQGQLQPSQVKDRVVLIGVTAPSIKDMFPNPYSANQKEDFEMPGVILHAQMVSQILGTVLDNRTQFWFWDEGQEWLWIWGWSVLGGILVWRLNHPIFLGLAVAIAGGVLWVICFLVFTQGGWIPFFPPILGLIGTSVSVVAYKVFYRTYHDTLTGLPNRRLFIKQLKQANQQFEDSWIVVLFLDLDRFKMINDGLGHTAGDYMLKTVAKRLKDKLDHQQKLARVGGDEFAIFFKSQGDQNTIINLAKQLQEELTRSFLWNGQEIFTTVSIGIAFDMTGQNFQAEDLLRNAHIAMYWAKELGSDRHKVFLPKMRTQAVNRLQLETQLRGAVNRLRLATDLKGTAKQQEFQLYYQPIISLKTLKIAGFEALVRWDSPYRGFVSPGDFIPIAEETDLIVDLGEWILAQACRQMRDWHEKFPQYPPLMISVNLSGRQFSQVNLVKQIKRILEDVDIERHTLKLEITESIMMEDVEEAIALLKRLKELGLKLSIDDFGTGYSSLSHLHRFPIDALKVDQSFVGRIDESQDNDKYTEIIRTIVMLGHNLQLDVVAEGIETEAQMKVLRSLNCEYGQGYFFSKPLPTDSATELLTKAPQW